MGEPVQSRMQNVELELAPQHLQIAFTPLQHKMDEEGGKFSSPAEVDNENARSVSTKSEESSSCASGGSGSAISLASLKKRRLKMPAPRIMFISAFLCAPFILFVLMLYYYYVFSV